MAERAVNTELLRHMLTKCIQEEVRKVGFSKVVVGLSGGVDSSLVAYLASEALGSENVHACLLPYRTSSPESKAHAEIVVTHLGIHEHVLDISPMVDAYFAMVPEADMARRGNKMARERMAILYDYSASISGLVLGTSNKSEQLLGYGTIYGDMASALHPLGDLYKTQVWLLAEAMGVPKVIREKEPTADLWVGQTDEGELGFSYRDADRLLYHMVDLQYNRDELIAMGFQPKFIDLVRAKIQNSQFKRRLPVIAKVSNRTIDRDFRYARDWGR